MAELGVDGGDKMSFYATHIENGFAPRVNFSIDTSALAVGMTFEIPYYRIKALVGVVYEVDGVQPNGSIFNLKFYTIGSSIVDIMDSESGTFWQGNYKYKKDETGEKYIVTIDKQL